MQSQAVPSFQHQGNKRHENNPRYYNSNSGDQQTYTSNHLEIVRMLSEGIVLFLVPLPSNMSIVFPAQLCDRTARLGNRSAKLGDRTPQQDLGTAHQG